MTQEEIKRMLAESEAKSTEMKNRLAGDTPRVRDLKRKLVEAVRRDLLQNDRRVQLQPLVGHRLHLLEGVRNELMNDTSTYFGTLDHKVIRSTHEYESLNKRQQLFVSKNYNWMIQELQDDHTFESSADEQKLFQPLQLLYDKMDEQEQKQFVAKDRMFFSASEIVGSSVDGKKIIGFSDDLNNNQKPIFDVPISSF